MAEFIPRKGHENCPKCFGWQWLDKTLRNAKTFDPIGPPNYVNCDRCEGRGDIPIRAEWERPKGAQPPAVAGWGSGVAQPFAWPSAAPVEPVEEAKPTTTGWAIFNDKEPGK
jgi:hypothetical protein